MIYLDKESLSANKIISQRLGFSPCIRLTLDFTKTEYKTYLAQNQEKLDSYKGELRTYANVVTSKYESQEFYAELYDAGINYMLVNNALSLCTYIANNCGPASYN